MCAPKMGRFQSRAAVAMNAISPVLKGDYTHAVLMGDLIESEAAPSVRQLHQQFNHAVDQTNQLAADRLVSPLTITLGDEFQGVCRSLSDGLWIMRRVRYALLSQNVFCRFALGVVRLETEVPADRAWNMMGPGLSATRDRLADKKDPNVYRFQLPEHELLQSLLGAIGYAATAIERDWSARQQQIVLASAEDKPATQLASELGLATRTLYKIRNSARFDVYQSQWRAMMKAAKGLDHDYGLPSR